jgi:SRSO17 transposase
LAASFAAVRVRIADGPPQRIHDKGMQRMPGEEAWLVGERRASGERKYYLSNLPPDASLRTLAAAIKARWVCEQAHQQLNSPLTKSSSADSVLSWRHNGNQRWRWGDQRLFRMI